MTESSLASVDPRLYGLWWTRCSITISADWRDGPARSSISHALMSKIFPNLPIWWFNSELRGIMVNKGWIHREIRKFLMFSSKLIKSNDELMIAIGENGKLWKRTSNWFHEIKNYRIWSWFRREIEDRSGKKFSDEEIWNWLKLNQIKLEILI